MCFRKYFYVVFLILFFQSPVFAKNTEEKIFYEQILNFYEVNNMQKFYSLLTKFQKIYPASSYKNVLFTLAAKKLYEGKRYKDALFFFNQISKSSLSKMQNYYADCHLKLGNYGKVIGFYEKVPYIDSRSKQILVNAHIGVANSKNESFEQKQRSITAAIEILESENKALLSDASLLELAKLYIRSEQFKKSANILKQLLSSKTLNKEDVLIQLSYVQKHYNINQSINTLSKVIAINGKHKELASYRKMVMLFSNNQHNNLISSREEIESSLNKEMLPLFHYYLGVAFLKNNEYTEAEKQFNIYLSDTKNFKALKLFAFENLKKIAQKKDDGVLLSNINSSIAALKREKTVNILKSKILRDEIDVDLSKALIFKKDKKFDIAEKILKKLLKKGDVKEKSSVHFELAHLYYINTQYEKAKNSLKSFIANNPNSSLIPLAWSYYIESSVNLAKNPENEHAKARLMYDVMLCLKKNQHLNKKERTELMFLLARTQYELTAFEESIATVDTMIKNYNLNSDILAKCYLILGYSHKNAFADNESFVAYVKKAIDINSELIKNEQIQAILQNDMPVKAVIEAEKTIQAKN